MPKGPNLDPTCEPFQRVCVSKLLDVCESGKVEARGARLVGDTHLWDTRIGGLVGDTHLWDTRIGGLVGDTHLWDTRIGGLVGDTHIGVPPGRG